jgi:hypothetical protein
VTQFSRLNLLFRHSALIVCCTLMHVDAVLLSARRNHCAKRLKFPVYMTNLCHLNSSSIVSWERERARIWKIAPNIKKFPIRYFSNLPKHKLELRLGVWCVCFSFLCLTQHIFYMHTRSHFFISLSHSLVSASRDLCDFVSLIILPARTRHSLTAHAKR